MNFEQFMEAVAEEHPEVARRKSIDANVAAGMSPEVSHEATCGQVDLRDAQSKGRLAATMKRLQKSNGPKSPDMDPRSKSIYAQDRQEAEEKNGKQ